MSKDFEPFVDAFSSVFSFGDFFSYKKSQEKSNSLKVSNDFNYDERMLWSDSLKVSADIKLADRKFNPQVLLKNFKQNR
jgi:hypothetical protein